MYKYKLFRVLLFACCIELANADNICPIEYGVTGIYRECRYPEHNNPATPHTPVGDGSTFNRVRFSGEVDQRDDEILKMGYYYNTVIKNATFTDLTIEQARFASAESQIQTTNSFNGSTFKGKTLIKGYSNLDKFDMRGTKFENLEIQRNELARGWMQINSLKGIDFSGIWANSIAIDALANFILDTNMQNAQFTEAKVYHLIIGMDVDLTDASFSKFTLESSPPLNGGDVSGLTNTFKISSRKMDRVNFNAATIPGANLDVVSGEEMSFVYTTAPRISMLGVNIPNADVACSNFSGAMIMAGAIGTLRGTVFAATNLTDALIIGSGYTIKEKDDRCPRKNGKAVGLRLIVKDSDTSPITLQGGEGFLHDFDLRGAINNNTGVKFILDTPSADKGTIEGKGNIDLDMRPNAMVSNTLVVAPVLSLATLNNKPGVIEFISSDLSQVDKLYLTPDIRLMGIRSIPPVSVIVK